MRQPGPPERAFTATFALIATAIACSIVVLVAPRPVMPSRLPALRLDPALVEAQLVRDREAAASARSDPETGEFLRAYAEEGMAEVDAHVAPAHLASLRTEVGQRATRLLARIGPEGTHALVAFLSGRALELLRDAPTSLEARGLLGSFPRLLAQYGYTDARGVLLAPALSVSAIYKARFNVLAGRAPATGLSAIELQAYEGWNALHAGGLVPERRAEAARTFRDAGGAHGAEALAIWLYHGGARELSLELLQRGADEGVLRMRNMALFALQP